MHAPENSVGYAFGMLTAKESVLPLLRRCTVIAGPTGSGKSALALAVARQTGAEIVCVDSMTLYRGFDIGTAKPVPAELAQVTHHLLDLLNPDEDANAGWWLDMAREILRSIMAKGKRAILVGGTALYFQLLFQGMAQAPPKSDAVREELEARVAELGAAAMHQRLAVVDPLAAARIHPNDARRIVRALEVHQLTGRGISQFQTQWDRNSVEPSCGPMDGERWVWLTWPRETLRQRIAKRAREMINAGWLQEVASLEGRFGTWGKTAGQAVGYAILRRVLRGELKLEEAERKIVEGTCQVAKRQETWFRSMRMLTPLPGHDCQGAMDLSIHARLGMV